MAKDNDVTPTSKMDPSTALFDRLLEEATENGTMSLSAMEIKHLSPYRSKAKDNGMMTLSEFEVTDPSPFYQLAKDNIMVMLS